MLFSLHHPLPTSDFPGSPQGPSTKALSAAGLQGQRFLFFCALIYYRPKITLVETAHCPLKHKSNVNCNKRTQTKLGNSIIISDPLGTYLSYIPFFCLFPFTMMLLVSSQTLQAYILHVNIIIYPIKLTDHEAFATVLNECTTAVFSLWVII